MLSPTSFFKTPSYFWNQAVPSAMSAGIGSGVGAIDPSALRNQHQSGDSFSQSQHQAAGAGQQDAWASPDDFLDGLDPSTSAVGAFDSGSASAGGGIGPNQDGPVVRPYLFGGRAKGLDWADLMTGPPPSRITRFMMR